jgi:hypothetical protein
MQRCACLCCYQMILSVQQRRMRQAEYAHDQRHAETARDEITRPHMAKASIMRCEMRKSKCKMR